MSIPSLTGYTTTYANVGETKNKGIDITLNTLNVKYKDFTWETSFNAAWQNNEIVSLSNGKSDDISNNWFIGQPLGVIYGYASAGLWKASDAADKAKPDRSVVGLVWKPDCGAMQNVSWFVIAAWVAVRLDADSLHNLRAQSTLALDLRSRYSCAAVKLTSRHVIVSSSRITS